MLKRHSDIYASCPWCEQGKTMANNTADIIISCQCSICGKYYEVDFKTMRVYKIRPKTHKRLRIEK